MVDRAAAGVIGAVTGLQTSPRDVCPKHMTYGPCGGVRPDGACEIGGLRCPFVDIALREWTGPAAPQPAGAGEPNPRGRRLRAALDPGPVVVADFPARALDTGSVRACAAALSDADAVLLGDSPSAR